MATLFNSQFLSWSALKIWYAFADDAAGGSVELLLIRSILPIQRAAH